MLDNDIRNYRMMDEYLAHHGILGQKHGVRNGPPYPLKAGSHSSSEKKAASKAGVKIGKSSGKGSIENVEKKRELLANGSKPKTNIIDTMIQGAKNKKIDKQRVENLQKARAAKEAKAAEKAAAEQHEADKKKALESGDYNEIAKYAHETSTEDLKNAMTRAKTLKDLNDAIVSNQPVEPSIYDQMDKVANALSKTTNLANKGKDAWNAFAGVWNTFVDDDTMLPEIGKNYAEEREKRKKAKMEAARKKEVERLQKENDVDNIIKNRKMFTNTELNDALNRYRNEQSLKDEKSKKDNQIANDLTNIKEEARKQAVNDMQKRNDPEEILKNREMFTNDELKAAFARMSNEDNIRKAAEKKKSNETSNKEPYEDYDFPDDDNGSMNKAKKTVDDVWEVVDNPKSANASNSELNRLLLTSIWDID